MDSAASKVEHFPDEVAVALCVYGSELDPEEVSALLGTQPTHSHRRGDRGGLKQVPAATGAWIREVRKFEPVDLNAMVAELLEGVAAEQDVWQNLSRRFEVRIDFAVHTDVGATFNFAPGTLSRLASLGAGLQVYIQAYGEGA